MNNNNNNNNNSRESKKSRISHVCDACRQKKVKCDKKKPICTRCTKLGLKCVYTPFRKKEAPATIESLQNELEILRAKLARTPLSSSSSESESTYSCASSSPNPNPIVSWNSISSPVKFGGVWKAFYPPFSDFGLFARDPCLRTMLPELFDPPSHFKVETTRSSANVLQEIIEILPPLQQLQEMLVCFESNLYKSYPFFNISDFSKVLEEIISMRSKNSPHRAFVLGMCLVLLRLQNSKALSVDRILSLLERLNLLSSSSENNLACLLYFKLSLSSQNLCLESRDKLSSAIANMALEMGLFASNSFLKESSYRDYLWMGSVILIDSNYFADDLFQNFCEPSFSSMPSLVYRYRIKKSMVMLSNSIMTSKTVEDCEKILEEVSSCIEEVEKLSPRSILNDDSYLLVKALRLDFDMIVLLQPNELVDERDPLPKMVRMASDLLDHLFDYISKFGCDNAISFPLKSVMSCGLSISERLRKDYKGDTCPSSLYELCALFKQKMVSFSSLWPEKTGWIKRAASLSIENLEFSMFVIGMDEGVMGLHQLFENTFNQSLKVGECPDDSQKFDTSDSDISYDRYAPDGHGLLSEERNSLTQSPVMIGDFDIDEFFSSLQQRI
ncbi:LAMI_0D13344g1_1 [Lachancea mirantina]|uniref:LAMI_0D13344g1_1 n=1 Tax=Lachancea mirantina TaxID=1230905 RepID=A0A1G4JGA6_9SACH|nr:LAMI_0D13344g1_1 [Lachancea mirantina]